MDCLGHVIDDNGIHPDVDKLQRIRDWRTPRNYHDVQRFVGLVNYVANFLPDVTAYTAPVTRHSAERITVLLEAYTRQVLPDD
jgi:hypothetical protein